MKEFEDLDAMLAESMELAQAKRARALGKKLSTKMEAALEAADREAESVAWHTQRYIAYVSRTSCECGGYHEEFIGWYAYQTGTRGGRRLMHVAQPGGDAGCYRFDTEMVVKQCIRCLSPKLPGIKSAELDILTTLVRGASHEF